MSLNSVAFVDDQMVDAFNVDRVVGRRLRERRLELALRQRDLADAVGLTFQQIQKYEGGTSKISAGRLYQFAHILGVNVEFFFSEAIHQAGASVETPLKAVPDGVADDVDKLVQFYQNIDDQVLRRKIVDLAKALSNDRA